MMMAPPKPPDTDPLEVSREFLEAAAYLREMAPHIATGSRDFGRGYMLAARMLEGEAVRLEAL
jgi:protein involved in ribonucleotide reduction